MNRILGRWIVFCTTWFLVSLSFMILTMDALAAQPSLQTVINNAKPGETIVVPAGEYQGPIVVNGPIELIGNGKVTIQSNGDGPVILLRGEGITLSGFHINDTHSLPKEAAIVVEGSNHELKELSIQTSGTGIKLVESHGNQISGITIEGLVAPGERTAFSKRGNGIDLRKSRDNYISDSWIVNMQDGIYLESSEKATLEKNYAANSRYGYHLMFTDQITIHDNDANSNVNGLMVMGANETTITHNRFKENNENVNSQGLLIFDSTKTVATNNHLEGNRIGLHLELATDNQFINNQVLNNFVGIQALFAENNEIIQNHFISNVIQAQAQESPNNLVKENYWDNVQGIDLQGDFKSDLPYRINPFFLTLTESVPPFQLFFHSPGLMFLEGLFQDGQDQWMTDQSPMMQPILGYDGEYPTSQPISVLLISSFLLFLSLITIRTWGFIRK